MHELKITLLIEILKFAHGLSINVFQIINSVNFRDYRKAIRDYHTSFYSTVLLVYMYYHA